MFRIHGWISVLIFVFSFSTHATVAEYFPEFYTKSAEDSVQFEEKYRWLYEEIIPEETRTTQPRASERSFEVHLKDSRKFFPHPQELITNKLSTQLPYKATGKITYVGFYKARYAYDLFLTQDTLTLEVRVHFRPEEDSQWDVITEKMRQAEEIWNASKFEFDFNYQFRFVAERDRSKAHFSVNLKKGSTRGPYFQNWTTRWSSNTVAHELGHMMGLGDEYRTLSGKMDCLKTSLMCSSSRGSITFQHHYHVLRRALREWKKNVL